MDGARFDQITRAMANGASRRRVLGGLAAAVAGAVGLSRSAGAQPTGKREICHLTHSASNPFVIIDVSGNAAEEARHLRHGDALRGDCCVDSECSRFTDQCNVGECVVDPNTNVGNCAAVPTPGVACSDDFACTTGDTCDANGDCVGTPDDTRCDDSIACTDDTCDPTNTNADADGCVYTPNTGDPCDDGDSCTEGETCQADGSCGGGTNICPETCATSLDCPGRNQCCCKQQGQGGANRCVAAQGCTGSNNSGGQLCCIGQNETGTVPANRICPA